MIHYITFDIEMLTFSPFPYARTPRSMFDWSIFIDILPKVHKKQRSVGARVYTVLPNQHA